MKKTVLLIGCLSMLLLTHSAFAADAAAGKAKAAICSGCHGQNGISPSPAWPNLAGQKARYLEKQLKDYKSGARKDAMMSPQAAMLSEADMANLAAYYESLSCK